MPLIKCKDCDKEISDAAEACPHCGAETELTSAKKAKKRARNKTIMIVVAVFIGLLVARALYVKQQNDEWERLGGPEVMRDLEKSMRELQESQRSLDRSRDQLRNR